MQVQPFQPGVVKPEEDYLELQRLSAKLGIPVPMTFVTVESKDSDGIVVDHYHDRSRTFNRNFWNASLNMFSPTIAGALVNGAVMHGDGFYAVRDYVGSTFDWYNAVASYGNSMPWNPSLAVAGTATQGIVVGIGTADENFEHNRLCTRVPHAASGAGTLSYLAQNAAITSWNSGTNTWTVAVTRVMNNNSGATLNITETGIYGNAVQGTSVVATSVMFCRDKLGAAIDVLAGGTLTVTYTITLTLPTLYPTYSFNTHVAFLIFNDSATNGTTNFIDQSSYSRTVTVASAGPSYSATTPPTGMVSTANFTGTGYLTMVDDSVLELADKDWVLEFNIFAISATGTVLAKRANSTAFGTLLISRNSSTTLTISLSSNGTSYNVVNALSIASVAASTWYKIQIIKSGTRLQVFKDAVNSTQVNFSEPSVDTRLINNASNWSIGADLDGLLPFTGRISSMRLTVGHHRGLNVQSTATMSTVSLPLALT